MTKINKFEAIYSLCIHGHRQRAWGDEAYPKLIFDISNTFYDIQPSTSALGTEK